MTYEIGSRCHVCGSGKQKVDGLFMPCEDCDYAAEHMKPRLMEWVQAVAQKASADAMDDMWSEMRRRDDP